ncbi:hypothetical protein GCM10010106_07130 [Thermopolyspora flexuosa]|uniref:DUF6286 domain-containing protein n=1 Tax=Thermopolyspora flexuosa TaxID=103836 RepID=A0A543IZI2_9ACTN|nr:DUF6286 domain-containing protein [Thermopolyspora flexuosa]TQM75986.1 hypothetical protein FHX40_2710 [Thermopolyspora flexuosa]GGM63736.1 hypothetical protein GCM10010106_07130 [Thermopolyspora flexuosa]
MTDTTAVPDLSRECLRRAGRASPRAWGHGPRSGWHRLPGRRDPGGRPACARAGHRAAPGAAAGSGFGAAVRARIGARFGAVMTTAARVARTTLRRLPGGRGTARATARHAPGGAVRHRRPGRRRACAASHRIAAERVAALRALRPARSPASVVAALVLVGAGAVAVAETFLVVAERAPHLVAFEPATLWAQDTTWRDPAALGTAGVVTVLGVVLVLAAVLPGRPRLVPLRTGDPDLVLGVSRPMLAALIAGEVARVTGVRRVRVRLRRRRLLVTACTDERDAEAVGDRVREAAERELARLDPLISLTVRSKVRPVAAGERAVAGAR